MYLFILDFLDCSITPQTQESPAQTLTNFFSIKFYTLTKGFYYNFRITFDSSKPLLRSEDFACDKA